MPKLGTRKRLLVYQVGRGSPCPVLQQPIYLIIMKDSYLMEDGYLMDGYLMEDGARRPPSYLVCFAWRFFALRYLSLTFCILEPHLVGRGSPCPVLQHPIYLIIMEDGYLMEDAARGWDLLHYFSINFEMSSFCITFAQRQQKQLFLCERCSHSSTDRTEVS